MSIIVYGPQGSGKTSHAEALRKHFKLNQVIEAEQDLRDLYKQLRTEEGCAAIKAKNALILTLDAPPASDRVYKSRRIMSIDEAKRQAGITTTEA